jgi:hypothetical protein
MFSRLFQFANSVKIKSDDLPNVPKVTPDSALSNGLKIVFALAGAIAVLIIVIAGLRMTTSSGNPEAVNKARNTIIFASIGLAFCVASFSIVTFLLNRL